MPATENEPVSPGPAALERTKRRGTALFVLGLALIVWGVFHVLGSIQGDEPWPTEFAERKSYNQVKTAVQGSFFGGFVRGFLGLGLCAVGLRMRERGTVESDAALEPAVRVTVRGHVGPPPQAEAGSDTAPVAGAEAGAPTDGPANGPGTRS